PLRVWWRSSSPSATPTETVPPTGRAGVAAARTRPRRRATTSATVRAGGRPGPGPGVLLVLDRQRGLAQLEWPEGGDHDRQLVHEVEPARALRRAELGAVGEPARVQQDRALLDPGAAPRLVVAAGVEQHLVGVDVVVVVRHRDRQRVVVDLSGD